MMALETLHHFQVLCRFRSSELEHSGTQASSAPVSTGMLTSSETPKGFRSNISDSFIFEASKSRAMSSRSWQVINSIEAQVSECFGLLEARSSSAASSRQRSSAASIDWSRLLGVLSRGDSALALYSAS